MARIPLLSKVEAAALYALTRTAVKTANYTAGAGELVPCDTTSTAITVTLPTNPPVGSRVGVKLVTLGAGHAVTITCGGSDVFNKTGGATTASLTLLNQAMQVQYDTGGIWTVVADDIPKSQLDATFLSFLQAAMNPDLIIAGAITRDAATGAATAAPVVWPDGSTGTYTADTVSASGVDAYHVTKVTGGVTTTYTQPAVTRDGGGNVTNRPAMTVA